MSATKMELHGMMHEETENILVLGERLMKEMDIISEDFISSRYSEVETFLGRIKAMKNTYQDEMEDFVEKYIEVVENPQVLEKWTKEVVNIASIVKKHANKIRIRAQEVAVAAKPVLRPMSRREIARLYEDIAELSAWVKGNCSNQTYKPQNEQADKILNFKDVTAKESSGDDVGIFQPTEASSDKPDPEPPDQSMNNSDFESGFVSGSEANIVNKNAINEEKSDKQGEVTSLTSQFQAESTGRTNDLTQVAVEVSQGVNEPDKEPPDKVYCDFDSDEIKNSRINSEFSALEIEQDKDVTRNPTVNWQEAVTRISSGRSVTYGIYVTVDGQDVNIDFTTRVKKPADDRLSEVSYQKFLTKKVDQIVSSQTLFNEMIKYPPDILPEDLLGEVSDPIVSLDPPPVKVKKPPDKVEQVNETVKFGVKVIVTLRLISSVELKFQMWGSVLTVCEEDIWQFNNSTNTTTTTLLGSDANQTILG